MKRDYEDNMIEDYEMLSPLDFLEKYPLDEMDYNDLEEEVKK